MKKCVGCGIELQTEDKNKLGYTEKEENTLCERCFKLKHYGQYKQVSLKNDDYLKILNSIPKNANILYITDILSLDTTYINKFNNITLVVTKYDLLPKTTKKEKIINYLNNNIPSLSKIFIINNKSKEEINEIYKYLTKLNNKQVYVIGTTNTGKSTLINNLIKLEEKDISTVTTSIYPSTTLDIVEVNLNKLTLLDTPGLINQNNIVNHLNDNEIKEITPKKTIKPKTCQLNGKGSIKIGEYIRIDYNSKEKNSIVIYTANNLKKEFISKNNNFLYNKTNHKYNIENNKDIVFLGIGFIKITKPIELNIYIKENISPIIRDNLI